MEARERTTRKAGWAGFIAIAVLLAGCTGNVAGELSRNVQVRDRVMGAIAADSTLSRMMAHRMLANDELRIRVVESVLADDRAAQYVLVRIGRNDRAVEYVLQAAAADSTSRAHLMTLLKGMQIAMQAKK